MSSDTLDPESLVTFASFALLLLPNRASISTFSIYSLNLELLFSMLRRLYDKTSLLSPLGFFLSSPCTVSPQFHTPPPLSPLSPAEPDWASVTLGVFVCQACSLLHRSIPHITRVKSVQDTWEASEVEVGQPLPKEFLQIVVPMFFCT